MRVNLPHHSRIEDSEGFVVTLDYAENLTELEYTVIEPPPAGADIAVLAYCLFMCPKSL